MKILIENASILTMNSQKQFVQSGYLFIDKGNVISYGEGSPPLELEFADYVINESFAVALPGFVVGMGNILHYLFQFVEDNTVFDMLSTLSRVEFETVLEVSLASLTFHGVTSVVTVVRSVDEKFLQTLATASTNNWTRVRAVIPISLLPTAQEYEHVVKTWFKGVVDQDAIAKRIVSLGILIENKNDLSRLSKELVDAINSSKTFVYIDSEVFAEGLPLTREINNIVLLNPRPQTTPCIYTSVSDWKLGCGFMSYDIGMLNPRKLLPLLHKALGNAYNTVSILSHENPLNNRLGSSSIREAEQADIVIMSFREPPHGPIPLTEHCIVNALSNGFYTVKTVIVGGEIVFDNGLHLFVGEEKIRRAGSIISELSRKLVAE